VPITVHSAKNNGHFICYTDTAKETLSFVLPRSALWRCVGF